MRRRPPSDDVVPAKLRDPSAWPSNAVWMAARDAWMAAGNNWPGGEVAEFAEVLAVIIATPDEPWDGQSGF